MTLIELLITTTILSVISMAIYATLNSGLKIWKRVGQPLVQEDLVIFFDRFSRDIRNSVQFTGLSFTGTKEKVEFPTILHTTAWPGNTVVGRASYVYDPEGKTLTRVQQDFSQIYTGDESIKVQPLPDLVSAKFQYYIYDQQIKEYSWREELLEGDLPVAVRIEMELGNGAQAQSFQKTVSIPLSS